MSIIGEALLATTGIKVALEPGPVKVTPADLQKADALPGRFRARLAAFLEADEPKKTAAPKPLDYDRMLELLTEPLTDERLRENVAGWGDQEVANEYADALGRAWGYLQSEFPVRTREHLSGTENLHPRGLMLARFRRLLEIVEDPETIVDRMDEGALLAAEVQVLKDVYPAIAEMLQGSDGPIPAAGIARDALATETARRRKKDPDWNLPRSKAKMLRRLLKEKRPRTEARTLGEIKRLYDEERAASEQPQPEKPMPGEAQLKSIEQTQTRQQRIEAK